MSHISRNQSHTHILLLYKKQPFLYKIDPIHITIHVSTQLTAIIATINNNNNMSATPELYNINQTQQVTPDNNVAKTNKPKTTKKITKSKPQQKSQQKSQQKPEQKSQQKSQQKSHQTQQTSEQSKQYQQKSKYEQGVPPLPNTLNEHPQSTTERNKVEAFISPAAIQSTQGSSYSNSYGPTLYYKQMTSKQSPSMEMNPNSQLMEKLNS